MKDFIFSLPTQVYFGKDSFKKLPEVLSSLGRRCLLLWGQRQAKQIGVLSAVKISLKEASLEFEEFSGIKPNPRLNKVREGIRLAREFCPDFLVALGGGSVIDSAKAIAGGIFYDGDVWELFERKGTINRALPVVAIPTIAGTGSELNDVSVIVNEDLGLKLSFRHPALWPRYTFIDPRLTFTVPLDLTVYGIMDAFAHCFEFYHFSKHFGRENLPFDLAVLFMKKLIYWGKKVLSDPNHYEARANIFWISSLALSGFLRAGIGSYRFFLHSLEHPLSGTYDLPHGLNLSLLIASYLKLFPHRQRVRSFLADLFGLEQDLNLSQKGLKLLQELYSLFRLPSSLRELGVREETLSDLMEKACQILFMWKVEDEFSRDDVKRIYRLAWEGPF